VGEQGRGTSKPPGGGRLDEARDGTRRTRLANERTHLAWWRTGLTALAVSVGAGRIVPELTGGPRWPYAALGIAYGLFGIVCIGYGFRRFRAVEQAVFRGEYASPDARFAAGMTIFGVLVGVATVLVVAVEH
jgi:putative membrane protein